MLAVNVMNSVYVVNFSRPNCNTLSFFEIDTFGSHCLLSSALPEDREIRVAIQKDKLVIFLDFHHAEIILITCQFIRCHNVMRGTARATPSM